MLRYSKKLSLIMERAVGAGGTIMRTETAYPDGVVVGLVAIDNVFSACDDFEQGRLLRLKVDSTTVAEYDYIGLGTLVGTRLFQPGGGAFSNRFGSTSGLYPELDRFNRPVAGTWTKDLSTDINSYDVTT